MHLKEHKNYKNPDWVGSFVGYVSLKYYFSYKETIVVHCDYVFILN